MSRVEEQYAGDGIAARALAYGMSCIRVDGRLINGFHFSVPWFGFTVVYSLRFLAWVEDSGFLVRCRA